MAPDRGGARPGAGRKPLGAGGPSPAVRTSLPRDIFARLEAAAQRRGITLAALAREILVRAARRIDR
jgi:hypothetical protein